MRSAPEGPPSVANPLKSGFNGLVASITIFPLTCPAMALLTCSALAANGTARTTTSACEAARPRSAVPVPPTWAASWTSFFRVAIGNHDTVPGPRESLRQRAANIACADDRDLHQDDLLQSPELRFYQSLRWTWLTGGRFC